MRRCLSRGARPVAFGLALLLGLAFSAPPAGASELAPKTQPMTLAAKAQHKVAAMDAGRAVRFTQGAATTSGGDTKPFFRSTKGVIAIVLMAAGVGYTFYSKREDRVSSKVR